MWKVKSEVVKICCCDYFLWSIRERGSTLKTWREMAMNRFFRCFCINRFGMGTLQYNSSRSDFDFEFVEIFVFEKRLPAINNTGSRRLGISVIRGVADSPYQWYAESLTPRIVDTGSRLLNFLKERESTPRISVTVSRRLPVSLSRVIDDSVYHWYGELTTPRIVESRSRHSLYWWVTIW
jgi:hypothetical protein